MRLVNFAGRIFQYGPQDFGRLFRNAFKNTVRRQRKTTGNFTRWRKFAKLSCGFFEGIEQELDQDEPDSSPELDNFFVAQNSTNSVKNI